MNIQINIFRKSLLFFSLLSGVAIFSSCSQKISNPNISKLESREAILALNTRLNDLNLAVEHKLIEVQQLTAQIKDAEKDANDAAQDAKKASSKLASNSDNTKIANRAEKRAKKAASSVKKTNKLNSKLADANDDIADYKKDIEKTRIELAELESKIEFVPNQP